MSDIQPFRPEPGTLWQSESGGVWMVDPYGYMSVLGRDVYTDPPAVVADRYGPLTQLVPKGQA